LSVRNLDGSRRTSDGAPPESTWKRGWKSAPVSTFNAATEVPIGLPGEVSPGREISEMSPRAGLLTRADAIDRYTVLTLVGSGGMGDVYAAYDPQLDRKVAIKLLRARPHGRDDEGQRRLMREAQAIAKLSHPNVVVVYDAGTFQDQVFVAMEFVDGHTLRYWTQAEARPWPEVLKVFGDAGRGLAAAHEKGIIHRDFKPDNVMIGADGHVRVMDFGLARMVGIGDRAEASVPGPGERCHPPLHRPSPGPSSPGAASNSPPIWSPPAGWSPRAAALLRPGTRAAPARPARSSSRRWGPCWARPGTCRRSSSP
jgi:serine/threonine protein kinase